MPVKLGELPLKDTGLVADPLNILPLKSPNDDASYCGCGFGFGFGRVIDPTAPCNKFEPSPSNALPQLNPGGFLGFLGFSGIGGICGGSLGGTGGIKLNFNGSRYPSCITWPLYAQWYIDPSRTHWLLHSCRDIFLVKSGIFFVSVVILHSPCFIS